MGLGVLSLAVVLCLVMAALNWRVVYGVVAQPQMFLPPDFDTEPPVLGDMGTQLKFLAFSKTNAYRHHKAIAAARTMLEQIAANNAWLVYHTENAAVFTDALLAEFDAVILNNSSGVLFTTEQRLVLMDYLERGGGLVALHATEGETDYEWPWYKEGSVRGRCKTGDVEQAPRLLVTDSQHPIVLHLRDGLQLIDDWCDFVVKPSASSRILLHIDESGDVRPVLWTHTIGKGRVLYSTLGHVPELYADPSYLTLITAGIRWSYGG